MNKKKIESIYPLSPAQQGMLYETLRAPGTGIHLEQWSFTLEGPLDVVAFEQAWQWEMNRHSSLRTCFIWEDLEEPVQVVLHRVTLPLSQTDLRGMPTEQQSATIQRYLLDGRRHGFKLTRAPLMRLALFRLAAQTYHLVWTIHHILIDGWCGQLILQEVVRCYQALSSGKTFHLPPPLPYSAYITWLRQQDKTRAEQFWRRALQDVLVPTPLGRAVEVPEAALNLSEPQQLSGAAQITLPVTSMDVLQETARRQRVTINSLLQGCWSLLLSCYSQRNDVVFGITVSGRPAELPGVEAMVGLCINTLPLRIRLAPDAMFWSWLQTIQEYNAELRQYEYTPGGDIQLWSAVPAGISLYDSLLVVENYPGMVRTEDENHSENSISVTAATSQGAQTRYALTLLATPGSGLHLSCIYDARRFTLTAIQQILEHFTLLIESLAHLSDARLATLQALIPAEQIPFVRPAHVSSSDRRASGTGQAPHTPIEEILVSLCCDVLGQPSLSTGANFFELGGHSLLATQLVSRIREILHVDLKLRSVFEAPTIAQLALDIEQLRRAGQKITVPPLVAVPRAQPLPLSFGQERLWFLQLAAPTSAAYTIPSMIQLHGPLNLQALEESIQALIARHESLRTTFMMADEQAVQIVHSDLPLAVPLCDLMTLPAEQREKVARDLAHTLFSQPFQLQTGPLLRIWLLRSAEQEHILLLALHHIITDGWSNSVLETEITTLYTAFCQGKPSPLVPLHIQYADYAIWQRQSLQGQFLDTLLSYWRQQLQGARALELPTDRPRTAFRNENGAIYTFAFSETLTQELRVQSHREGATVFMILLAVLQILLARLSGQDDVVVGTNIAGRTRLETEGLIGFFVNLLALRAQPGGSSSFREVLRAVRTMVLDAYAHQELPFDMLVEHLRLPRYGSATPLINVLFVLQNMPSSTGSLAEIQAETLHNQESSSKFELAFFLLENTREVLGSVTYSTDLFDEQTIAQLVERYITLLASIFARPDAPIEMLESTTATERAWQISAREKFRQRLQLRKDQHREEHEEHSR